MPTFQDRERAFEAKYAHDEDLRFRVIARRDKLFAHASVEQLGLLEPAAAGLVASVLAVRDGPGHDSRLIQHMADVFAKHGHSDAAGKLSASLEACSEQAHQQLLAQPDNG